MKIRKVACAGATLVALSVTALATSAPAAQAEYAINLSSGDGTVLRAKLFEHANGAGNAITYKGGTKCTSTTTDLEYRLSVMPSKYRNSWNDSVSSWNDFNGCDVRFFSDEKFGGASTEWLNAGTATARNMPSGWNDVVSSFQVS